MTQTTQITRENPEWVLMAKALRGELSDEEQKDFELWLNADSSHAEQWAGALETWDEVGTIQEHAFEPDVQLAWEKVCSKASIAPAPAAAPEPLPQEAVVRSIFSFNQVFRYAAAAVVTTGLAWVGYQQLNQSPDWSQVATLDGERKTIYLPDSSQVILNENSTLRYQTAFTGEERQVELSGEGFFDVRKNPKQPFVIESGDARTQVLGTSFNVNAPATSGEVAVTVVTGKVSLSSVKHKNEVILTPGYTGKLKPEGTLEKVETSSLVAPAWRTLTFRNATLKEVSAELSSYFGVKVEVTTPGLLQCSFTGEFDNPQLKEILHVLAASNDVTITTKAPNTYAISGPGCQ